MHHDKAGLLLAHLKNVAPTHFRDRCVTSCGEEVQLLTTQYL